MHKSYNPDQILLRFVPDHTPDLVLKAIKQCPDAIKDAKIVNQEIYDAFVTRKPRMIKEVPPEYITDEMLINYIAQTMNIHDAPNVSQEHVLAAVMKNIKDMYICDCIKYLENYDYDLAMQVVKACPASIRFVKKDLIDYHMCETGVSTDSRAIINIPQDMITDELLDVAFFSKTLDTFCVTCILDSMQSGSKINDIMANKIVIKYPYAIKYFKNISNDTKMQMVFNDGMLLGYIEDVNKDLIMAAISNNPKAAQHLHPMYIDEHIANLCFNKCPNMIQYMANPTYEQCLHAVQHHGELLQYVPEQHQTVNLCIQAISKSCYSIGYVINFTDELEKMIRTAFSYNIFVKCVEFFSNDILSKYVSTHIIYAAEYYERHGSNIDPEIIMKLFDEGYDVIRDIPKDKINYGMCKRMVWINGFVIKNIPEEFVDYELCLIAVDTFGGAIKYIDKKFWDKKLIMAAINQNPWVIKYIAPSDCDYSEMVKLALEKNNMVLKCVNTKYVGKKILCYLVKHNGELLQYVIDQDLDICMEAVKSTNYKASYKNNKFERIDLQRLKHIKCENIKQICKDYLVQEYVNSIQ